MTNAASWAALAVLSSYVALVSQWTGLQVEGQQGRAEPTPAAHAHHGTDTGTSVLGPSWRVPVEMTRGAERR